MLSFFPRIELPCQHRDIARITMPMRSEKMKQNNKKMTKGKIIKRSDSISSTLNKRWRKKYSTVSCVHSMFRTFVSSCILCELCSLRSHFLCFFYFSFNFFLLIISHWRKRRSSRECHWRKRKPTQRWANGRVAIHAFESRSTCDLRVYISF